MKKKTALQYSMIAGAIYDWIFGTGILFIPHILAKIISLKMPSEEVYLRLNGLFLLIIGIFYFLYWLDSTKYRLIVPVAIAARLSGFIFFFTAWIGFSYPFTFFLLALGDCFWGILHTVLLLRSRK